MPAEPETTLMIHREDPEQEARPEPAATPVEKKTPTKMKHVRVPANEAFLHDLEELKRMMGAQTYSETIRRTVAYYVVLCELLAESRAVIVRGKNRDGREEYVTLP